MPGPAVPLTAGSQRVAAFRLVLAAGAIAICLLLSGCATTATIPDLKGLALPQAESALEEAGFAVGRVTYDTSLTAMTGVVWQDPSADERWDPGTVVRLIIAGRPPTTVPVLVGLSRDRAMAALSATGLTVGSVGETHTAAAAAGEVVSQTPTAGVEATGGAAVDFVVSLGPPRVAVPRVIGLSESAAKKRLKGVGLSVAISRAHRKAKRGTVAGQKPLGGTAAPGSTVRLTISTGPRPPEPKPAAQPAPKVYGGVLAIWATNSGGESDPRTGYAYVDIGSLGGVRVRARCPYSGIGEGSRVWVAKQASGAWVVTGRR